MKKIFPAIVAFVSLSAFAATAEAVSMTFPSLPSMPQAPSAPTITLPSGMTGDDIVQKDFALFQQLNIGQRFGITFHSHMNVCPAAANGEAACDARVVTDGKGSPAASATLPRGMSPAQFLKAYGLSGLAPTSATPPVIAIVDSNDDPSIASDLATYSSTYGLSQLPTCPAAITASKSPCFKKVNQTGATTRLPFADAGWALEISLDVETAHAICQNFSILLVEANSPTYANLAAAENESVALGANVISNSYGGSEFSGETSYDSAFNHPGVAVVASAGDSGYGVEYPAASRYVTAVGGTSLYLNSNNTYNSEVAWSGTGSGCSAFEAKQPWQTDAGCARRTVADVSADADPNTGAAVYDSVRYYGQHGWWQVGGTSLAAPLIAATYALSGNTSGVASQSPYAIGSSANLHDVTSGNNGSCGGSYLCTAQAGFDGPTGLGTPNGAGAY
jgi:subtilase family serine protease